NPADNLLFGYKVADETRRRFHLKLWNIYNFFVTYANLDSWKPTDRQSPNTDHKLSILDRWILSRLNETIKNVTEYLEKYDAYNASGLIEEFVDDLSNWYIRRSRERVGPAAESEKDKKIFYETLYFVLVSLTKVLVPLIPFLSDMIYTNLTKEESVHLADWPGTEGDVDKKLISDMQNARLLVEKAHAERKLAKIPVRQPLQSIEVMSPDKKLSKELLNLAEEELNLKEIKWIKAKEVSVKLDIRITPALEEESKARELIRKVQGERKKLGMNLIQKVKVINPWIPESKNIVQKVKRKTLAISLKKGQFKITKAS
ncbi:MAG: class I tRNA ligase family protein, partial [Microgenomates group bacterium]